jgi:hypothetical protein
LKHRPKRREKFETHQAGDFALDVRGPACDLLALFMADEPVHKLIARHGFRGIAADYTEYRDERIFKLMIEIATSYRLTSWRLSDETKSAERKKDVGLLFVGDDDDGVPLLMHEACNKIIHADEFLLETRKVRKAPFAYMREQIMASGTKAGKEWTICLWIPEFCEAALTMPPLDGLPF